MTVGQDESAEFRLGKIHSSSKGSTFSVSYATATYDAQIPLLGHHQAMNAALALGVVAALERPLEPAIASLATVDLPSGRLSLQRGKADIDVIDDSYNANPQSMRAALEVLQQQSAKRRVAVLGTMGELGTASSTLHEEVGEAAAALGVELLVAVGPSAEHLLRGAAGVRSLQAEDAESAAGIIAAEVAAGDVVLVKGSRSMRLERVVAALVGE